MQPLVKPAGLLNNRGLMPVFLQIFSTKRHLIFLKLKCCMKRLLVIGMVLLYFIGVLIFMLWNG